MERVLQIGDVAGIETLAQQEGRVDVVPEEDGLEAELVAGDAGGESLPPGLVQGAGLGDVVPPEKEVVLVQAGMAGEAFSGPLPVQAEGRPGIDLILQYLSSSYTQSRFGCGTCAKVISSATSRSTMR